MKKLWEHGSLTIVMMALFAFSILGQSLAGLRTYNEGQREHGQSEVTYGEYLLSGEFLESVFENWESEFLQMAAFLLFSAILVQKGSAESKKPKDEVRSGEPEEFSKDPRREKRPDSPGPVHRGGLLLKVYSHSLTLALFGLFLLSFFLHALGGMRMFNEEQLLHGGETVTMLGYMGRSKFWFESFQNWQSEFLSIGVLVVLSIWLRQKGSPESKPVHAPHAQTGESG